MKKLSWGGVSAIGVLVLVGFLATETYGVEEKTALMKEDLLNPRGFDMLWSCGGRTGWSRVFFRADETKIVADIEGFDIENVDINKPENFGPESCTADEQLADNGIIFNGCGPAIRGILLAYNPENRLTPFKGGGASCARIELNSR